MRNYYKGICTLLLLLTITNLSGQNESIENGSLDNIEGNRAEIQRYFGYEDLMFRFTTLPYDVSQNINQTGYFVDIGYIFLGLIPVIILCLLFKKKKSFYLVLVLSIVYLSTSLAYSHLRIQNKIYGSSVVDNLNEENLDLIDKCLLPIYSLSSFWEASFIKSINVYVSTNNSIVYLILFAVFVLSLGRIKNYSINNTLWIIFGSFLFLWILLSGGILWYGFLLIPVGTILIFQPFDRLNEISRTVGNVLLILICTWVLISALSRISYISYQNNEGEHAGKSIINGNLFLYSVGLFDDKETMDITAPSITKALERINSDKDLIYMVGTSYAFNIKNNYERIYNDPDLTGFYWIQKKFANKQDQMAALKASGFKFIVVDLHIPSLDKTPEQSLVAKFKLLMDSLNQNPKVSLIATDRIVEFIDSRGNAQKIANVFGQKVINFGSYAIYEIL